MEDINNVAVEVKNGEMDEEEIIAYIKYLEKKFPDETLKSLSIKIDGDEVDLDSGQTCIKKQLKSICFFNLILSHQCITDNKFLFL